MATVNRSNAGMNALASPRRGISIGGREPPPSRGRYLVVPKDSATTATVSTSSEKKNHLLYELVYGGDVCSGIFLIMILFVIGSQVVKNDARLQAWGVRIAFCTFVGSLILLCIETKAVTSEEIVWLAIRSLLLAGLALGSSWTLMPIIKVLHDWFIENPREARRREREEERRREENLQQIQAEERRAQRDREERDARIPEEQRQRRLAEQEARDKVSHQTRRDNARSSAFLSFSFYGALLRDRFPRSDFDHYVSTFMNDTHPPEVVEQRGRELISILDRLIGEVRPSVETKTVAGLVAWYESVKKSLNDAPIDERTKKTSIAQLHSRYNELMAALLEEMKP